MKLLIRFAATDGILGTGCRKGIWVICIEIAGESVRHK